MKRIGQAAKDLGVTPQTVRKWVRQGKLKACQTPGGHLLFDPYELDTLIGRKPHTNTPGVVFYLRSSSGQEASMETQGRLLEKTFGSPLKVYKDKAGGLNENRAGLKALLSDAKKGKFTQVAFTHPDRLTRFGYTYLTQLLQAYGVQAVSLDTKEGTNPQEELMKDFMSLLASFSGKFYRLRGWQAQRRLLDAAGTQVDTHLP